MWIYTAWISHLGLLKVTLHRLIWLVNQNTQFLAVSNKNIENKKQVKKLPVDSGNWGRTWNYLSTWQMEVDRFQ